MPTIAVDNMFKNLLEAFKKKFLCCHEWEQIKESEVYWSETDKRPTWVEITFLCKNVADLKRLKYENSNKNTKYF